MVRLGVEDEVGVNVTNSVGSGLIEVGVSMV
jgi:hypothetical protein